MLWSSSSNNTLINNTGISNLGYGIRLYASSSNNNLLNNTGMSNYSFGIIVQYSSNNTLINCTARSNFSNALQVGDELNSNFINQIAEGLLSGSRGISFVSSSNIVFRDCVSITGDLYDVYIHLDAGSVNNTFINCSYNINKESINGEGNELIRKWYYQAYVNYSNTTEASDVNITAYNVSGVIQFTAQTNATGFIDRQEITEYNNTGGTRSYYNNYSINATKTGYLTDSNVFNFTITQNKVNDYFTLTDSIPPTISFEDPTPENSSTVNSPTQTIVANISDQSNTSSWIDFDRSLVGYWAMDYYNSTDIFDNSTYLNNGTFGGGLNYSNLTTGARGQALTFDGSDDRLNVSNLDLTSTDKISVSFWINTLSTRTQETIMENGQNYNGNNAFIIITGDVGPVGHIEFSDSTGGYNLVYTSNAYNDGNWHHVVGIINRSAGSSEITIYVDGINDTVESPAQRADLNGAFANYPIYIGGRYTSTLNFTGSLDEIMVFSRALSQTEVLALYNSQSNKFNSTFTDLSEGQHNYTVYAVDEAGNLNDSGENNFIYSYPDTPPVIYGVTSISPVTLTDGPSPTFIIVNFSVYDANGASNLDNSTASINFTKANEELRYNSSCAVKDYSGNYANYTCNVTMWWWDASGNDWKVYANMSDLDTNTVVNDTTTFTVNTLTGFVMTPSALTFSSLPAGSTNQTPTNHFVLNNTGNADITTGNIRINATDLVGETDKNKILFAGNFSASIYTGGKIECNITSSATQMVNMTNIAITNTVLPAGNYTKNDGTGQEEVYLCLRQVGVELTQQQYSTDTFGSWTVRIALVAISIRRRKKKRLQNPEKIAIPITIFTKKLGALESLSKYMKENLGMSYHKIAELLNRDERTIWTAYHKSLTKQKGKINVIETSIFIPISVLNNRKLTVLESLILYLKQKDMKYSEIAKLLNRNQKNIWTIYSRVENSLNEKEITSITSIKVELNIPITIFSNKLGALETLSKYLKENLGMSYKEIAELLNRNERTIWTSYNKAKIKQKELIEVKETDIFLPISIFVDRNHTPLESAIIFLKKYKLKYSEIAKLLNRNQKNIWNIYNKTKNNI
jgi:parallel beta-helix repeat protein